MMSSEGIETYREKIDERPIRVDHGLVGERESEGSSVDGVSHKDISELLGGSEVSQMHPFCVLLNFTMEGRDTLSHPAFGEETVRDLCVRVLGRRYDKIVRLNQTDFLVELKASDNLMLFVIKLGNKHTWLGMELHMDAHIGTATTLKKVSIQHEEAWNIVNNTKMMPGENVMTSSEKTDMAKISEKGCHKKNENIAEKEDAMLKVLESMLRKIEELDRTAKGKLMSTSVPDIRGQDFRTPSSGTLTDQPQWQDGVYLMEQLPRVGYFSGEKLTPKGEIDLKRWKSDVTENLQNYPEL